MNRLPFAPKASEYREGRHFGTEFGPDLRGHILKNGNCLIAFAPLTFRQFAATSQACEPLGRMQVSQEKKRRTACSPIQGEAPTKHQEPFEKGEFNWLTSISGHIPAP